MPFSSAMAVQWHRQRAGIDTPGEQCLQADRFAAHRNHHDIFVRVQSASSKHRARGTVNRAGKAADGNFFAAQLSDLF
jgi:hypothetical protein